MKRYLLLLCLALAWLSACDEPADDRSPDARPPAPGIDAPAAVHCKGEPAICDSFDLDIATACAAQVGCVDDRTCTTNIAFDCFELTTETACAAVGCSWRSRCAGTGSGCTLEQTQSGCLARPGCRWDSYCDPLSRPSPLYCAQFTDGTTCDQQDACAWSYQTCSGTPAACATFTDETACVAQRGCTWDPTAAAN
ncbi:MAG TPA: hypothetical protein VM734_03545 [Kofleriaceae bacterium]|nr:hypothetical protein [Kofleriaceae bacterium]